MRLPLSGITQPRGPDDRLEIGKRLMQIVVDDNIIELFRMSYFVPRRRDPARHRLRRIGSPPG